jgi:hypothetical protein
MKGILKKAFIVAMDIRRRTARLPKKRRTLFKKTFIFSRVLIPFLHPHHE